MNIIIPKINIAGIRTLGKRIFNEMSVYIALSFLGLVIFLIIAETGRITQSPDVDEKAIFGNARDKSKMVNYRSIVNALNKPKKMPAIQRLFDIDILSVSSKTVPEMANYYIDSVRESAIPISYKGYIDFDGQGYVAQINKADSTFFLKEGSAFNGFSVLKISKDAVECRNKYGNVIILERLKPVYVNERIAVIAETGSEKRVTLFKGSILKNYEIKHIGESKAILANRINGKKILLEMKK
jgi:hypothetical protein